MLNKNKNESYICKTTLEPTPINPVVIENMRDIKQSESCNDADATVKCDNKKDNLRRYDNVANTTTTNQERATLKKILNESLYEKNKARTQGIRSARWAIADAGANAQPQPVVYSQRVANFEAFQQS